MRARAGEGEEEGGTMDVGRERGVLCNLPPATFPKEFIITRYDASSYFHRMQNRECHTRTLSHRLYRSASQSCLFAGRDGVNPTRDTLGCSSTLFKLLSNLTKIFFDTSERGLFDEGSRRRRTQLLFRKGTTPFALIRLIRSTRYLCVEFLRRKGTLDVN